VPCFKLGIKVGDPTILKDFLESGRSGFYLHVVEEGYIEAGDAVSIEERDPQGFSIADVNAACHHDKHNAALLARAASIESMPADWRNGFAEKLAKLQASG